MIENVEYENGISLSNFINIDHEITGDFDSYVISNPLYMHEYGHYLDSRRNGPGYLVNIGLPSLRSAQHSKPIPNDPYGRSTHDFHWAEKRANRYAKQYFSKYYGVDWDRPYKYGTIEDYYPTK